MGFFRKLFSGADAGEDVEIPLRTDFEPQNELEKCLKAFVDGGTGVEPVLDALVRSQVFVLLHGQPNPAGPPTPMKPLVMPTERGDPGLCVFTAPERSQIVQQLNPDYATGMLVDFSWVMKTAPAGLGLIVNRGWAFALECPPDGFDAMRRDHAR